MRTVFADTFYFLALLNRRDPAHGRAVEISRTPSLSLLTTEFVLLELADALCQPYQREDVLAICRVLETEANCRLIRAGPELLVRGRKLWQERGDKA